MRVRGLEAKHAGSDPPRVTALQLFDEKGRPERLAADWVLDATGRRTRADEWLLDAGAAPPACEREPCGIFYASRFYRFREGVPAMPIAPSRRPTPRTSCRCRSS